MRLTDYNVDSLCLLQCLSTTVSVLSWIPERESPVMGKGTGTNGIESGVKTPSTPVIQRPYVLKTKVKGIE